MEWEYENAPSGNIALAGEIDISEQTDFVLALSFGRTQAEAANHARASLLEGFDSAKNTYMNEWQVWQDSLRDVKANNFRNSAAILRMQEAKDFSGGIVASLSIPWGDIHGFFESVRSELIHDKSKVNLNMVQLPAMNTTQFGWVKSRLPRKPKPMGKIYEPEVAARVIFDTARHPEREVYVGYPTAKTIFGNKLVPGWLDHYLAKTGYKGQQTDQPEDPDRENNLWEPIAGDHGARGTFDAQAWDFSPKFWAATHKWASLVGTAVLGIGIGAVFNKLLSDR